MTDRILFVDDEPSLLQGIERMLFKERKRWEMRFELSGSDGLKAIAEKPFDVVVADMRMPEMDGIEFLTKVKKTTPDTVRMMLTGNADLETAIGAVNAGNVFRFMTKPCEHETLVAMLEAGLEQVRLIRAEKELLTHTLGGTIQLLSEMLSIADPKAYAKALWMRNMVKHVVDSLQTPNSWEVVLAAMLCQIGRLTLPIEVVAKADEGKGLSQEEKDMIARIPEIGYSLLQKIPRLETVATIILYQEKRFNGTGFPLDEVSGEEIPIGSRILKILFDLSKLSSIDTKYQRLTIMNSRSGWYDPELLEMVFPICMGSEQKFIASDSIRITLDELHMGQKLAANIETEEGQIVALAGSRISPTIMAKIRNFASLGVVKGPFLVETGTMVDS